MNLVGFLNAGSSGSTSIIVSSVANGRSNGQQVAELLLDHVADHALRLRAEDVERIGLVFGCTRRLQREQADLRAVAVADHDLMLRRDAARAPSRRSRTLARWFSAVIGSPRRSSALPPSAMTTQHGSVSQRGDEHRLDRVHAVFRLFEGEVAPPTRTPRR